MLTLSTGINSTVSHAKSVKSCPYFFRFFPIFSFYREFSGRSALLGSPRPRCTAAGKDLHTYRTTNTDLRDEKVFFHNRSFFKRKTLAADGTLPKIRELNAPLRNNKGLEDINTYPPDRPHSSTNSLQKYGQSSRVVPHLQAAQHAP